MKCRNCFLLLAFIFVSFAYYAYDPFPENAVQPMIQQLTYVPVKIIKDIVRILLLFYNF